MSKTKQATKPKQGKIAVEAENIFPIIKKFLYSEHEIFAINCKRDMDDDGIKDCLIAGRVGVSLITLSYQLCVSCRLCFVSAGRIRSTTAWLVPQSITSCCRCDMPVCA